MSASRSVLIVDDEIDTLKLLKIIVELSGYEAYTTLNSLEALTLAKVEQPDVILLDIMMPNLDGFQLCKMIRADPQTRNLPVIFVTAYSALDLEERRLASGGDMVLSKPVGMETLTAAIEQVQGMERQIPPDIQQASADMTVIRNPLKAKGTSPAKPSGEAPQDDPSAASTVLHSPLKGKFPLGGKDSDDKKP
jgi:CheY-like chemotaxis protein